MALRTASQVLFNPGPVNLAPELRENLFNVELCHRQPEFAELDASIRERLHHAGGFAPGSHRLSLMHGSGTLAVDASLASLVRGRVLAVVNGLYCERICRTLRGLDGATVIPFEAGLGRPPDLEELAAVAARVEPDWIAVVHHETTTGLLNPLEPLVALARRCGARVFVDAVSSFAVHPIPADVDVVCFSSSKCLESLPGIAGVFWRADLAPQRTVPVLDVSAYAEGIPSTPHVQAYVALDIALDLLAAEDRPARYRRLAHHVWESGERRFRPYLPQRDRSDVLTAFRLDGRDPDELHARALAHGYVIYHGQQQLRSQIFRVANMGAAMSEEVIDDLFEVLVG
jgi:2-aminoethylphosphonate-pyruvate transaminase